MPLNRRDFLKSIIALPAAAALPVDTLLKLGLGEAAVVEVGVDKAVGVDEAIAGFIEVNGVRFSVLTLSVQTLPRLTPSLELEFGYMLPVEPLRQSYRIIACTQQPIDISTGSLLDIKIYPNPAAIVLASKGYCIERDVYWDRAENKKLAKLYWDRAENKKLAKRGMLEPHFDYQFDCYGDFIWRMAQA